MVVAVYKANYSVLVSEVVEDELSWTAIFVDKYSLPPEVALDVTFTGIKESVNMWCKVLSWWPFFRNSAESGSNSKGPKVTFGALEACGRTESPGEAMVTQMISRTPEGHNRVLFNRLCGEVD